MRGPWGEGNGDGGVSARGSCQGGGCTAPRPCPGFPLSRERRWGRWREGFVSGWGMHRPAPLPWIPAFAGTTMGALARGACVRVGNAPPRAPALDSRYRGNDDGGVGARGSCQGGGCTAPRPCPGFPLSRERRWGRWREGFVSGWGMHRPAPLPWIPAFAGTTMGECGSANAAGGGGDCFPMLRVGPFRGALRTGSGRTDLGSARHAMGFERPSGLWHHCQGSVVGVWGSTLYACKWGGRTTAS